MLYSVLEMLVTVPVCAWSCSNIVPLILVNSCHPKQRSQCMHYFIQSLTDNVVKNFVLVDTKATDTARL